MHNCSDSQTSSTAFSSQDHLEDPETNALSGIHNPDVSANASIKTAQIAALLSSEAGQALVQRYLGQEVESHTAKAKQQAQQLAAMLSTNAGKATLQQQLSSYLVRKQQQQVHAAAQEVQSTEAGLAASLSSVGRAGGTGALPNGQSCPAKQTMSPSAASLKSLPPRVLSTALAVASTVPGSAERAVGLAALKRELLQHGAVPAALALVQANGDVLDPAMEVCRAASAEGHHLQQQRSVVGQAAAALKDSRTGQKVSAPALQTTSPLLPGVKQTPRSPASETPQTLAKVWAMLQQRDAAAAHGSGLARLDTQMSGVCSGSDMKGPSQIVFKRRANNSTALRRHFSSVHKAAAAPARSESSLTAVSKPHQMFKKQRKRPLMLWSSSGIPLQQVQAGKHQQRGQSLIDAQHSSDGAASSSLLAGSASTICTADAAAAASPASVARAASTTATVQNVLNTLVRQEQQLLILQQQLRQQRELMLASKQILQVGSGLPALQQLLMRAQNAAAQPAEVEMEDAWQSAAPVPRAEAVAEQQPEVAPDAAAVLVTLARQLAASPMPGEQAAAAVSNHVMGPPQAVQDPTWSAEVLTRLTAALLAA